MAASQYVSPFFLILARVVAAPRVWWGSLKSGDKWPQSEADGVVGNMRKVSCALSFNTGAKRSVCSSLGVAEFLSVLA